MASTEPEPNAARLLATLQRLLALDALDITATLTEASMLIGDTLQAEKVDLFFFDPQRATLTALGTSETPLAQHQRAIGKDQLPIANGGREVETFQTGHSYWTTNAADDPGMLPGVVQGLGARSLLIVPLSISTSRRGIIAVTATALTLLEEMLAPHFQQIRQLMSALSKEDQEQLITLLLKLERHIVSPTP